MDIGILTYYGVHNHGAVLQANALRTVLTSMGHNVGFLAFNRNYDMISQNQAKKYKIGLGSILFYSKYLVEKGAANFLYNLKKNRVLGIYRKEHFPISARYNDFTGDAVVIGSDEVFSLEIGVNPFLFGHGLKCDRVLSYAGSFGPTTADSVKSLHLNALIASGINSISAVSVRDGNSYEAIKVIAGRDATLVCDPVILYGYEQEMKKYIPNEKDYIVVYAYDKNMNGQSEVKAIRQYAKSKRLTINSVGYYHKWADKNIQATPEELLGWIKNATIVLTDTFHGSVMSIICNTPMVVKLCENQNKVRFLLEEYGLGGRITPEFNQIVDITEEIDFSKVNEKIAERRMVSMAFLKEALA